MQYAVVGEWLSEGVGVFALLHDCEEEYPILAFADWGHAELAVFGHIVDCCEAAYLVVALEVAEGDVLWCYYYSYFFVVFVAFDVGRVGETAVFLGHEGYLLLEFIGLPSVVAVAEGDVLSLCMFNGIVAAATWAFVLLEEEWLSERYKIVLLYAYR